MATDGRTDVRTYGNSLTLSWPPPGGQLKKRPLEKFLVSLEDYPAEKKYSMLTNNLENIQNQNKIIQSNTVDWQKNVIQVRFQLTPWGGSTQGEAVSVRPYVRT